MPAGGVTCVKEASVYPTVPTLALVHITANHDPVANVASANAVGPEAGQPSVRDSVCRTGATVTPRGSYAVVSGGHVRHSDGDKAAKRKSPLRRLSGAMSSLVHRFVRSDG